MKFDAQTLKMIGGGVIIAAAFAIMFPGFIYYVGGLMRVSIFIIVTLTIAFICTFTFTKIRSIKKPSTAAPPVKTDTTSDT